MTPQLPPDAVRERHMPGPAGMDVSVDIAPGRLELRTAAG
jgi:hypothetical protein